MKRKRKIIIDGKFQLRLALGFALVVFLTGAVLAAAASWMVVSNTDRLDLITANQKKLVESQEEIFTTLLDFARMKDLRNVRISEAEVRKDIESKRSGFVVNNESILAISRQNRFLVILMISFIIFQSGLVFYLLIKRSHRISGPVMLLNRYIGELIEGRYPEIRPLRSGDDFKGLFANFVRLVEVMKSRESLVESKPTVKRVGKTKKLLKKQL
jgi:hypothetical protein